MSAVTCAVLRGETAGLGSGRRVPEFRSRVCEGPGFTPAVCLPDCRSKLVASSSPEKPAAPCHARGRCELIELQPKSKEASGGNLWAVSPLKAVLRAACRRRAQALQARSRSSLTHRPSPGQVPAPTFLRGLVRMKGANPCLARSNGSVSGSRAFCQRHSLRVCLGCPVLRGTTRRVIPSFSLSLESAVPSVRGERETEAPWEGSE